MLQAPIIPTSAVRAVTTTDCYAGSTAQYQKDKYGNFVMSLSEIGLDAQIRFGKEGARPMFSPVDVVKAVTGKNQIRANECLEKLPENIKQEVYDSGVNLKFNGPGQKESTLITYDGVLKLIMALPGINAREMRTKFAHILKKYFAGDVSMVLEMAANAVSAAPMHVLAREEQGDESGEIGAWERLKKQVELMQMQQEECGKMMQMMQTEYGKMLRMMQDGQVNLVQIQENFQMTILNLLKTSKAQDRRQELYDKRADEKRKLREIEFTARVDMDKRRKLDELDVKKSEAEIALMERRLIPAKHLADLEKGKMELEMKKLDKENENLRMKIELKQVAAGGAVRVSVAGVPASTEPQTPKYFTVESVANYYKLFESVQSMAQRIRICNEARKKLGENGQNLPVLGYVADSAGNLRNPHFNSTDVRFIKDAVEKSIEEVLQINIGYN